MLLFLNLKMEVRYYSFEWIIIIVFRNLFRCQSISDLILHLTVTIRIISDNQSNARYPLQDQIITLHCIEKIPFIALVKAKAKAPTHLHLCLFFILRKGQLDILPTNTPTVNSPINAPLPSFSRHGPGIICRFL